jgi:tRNA A37 methylthiotransferase MiaB
MPIFVKLGPPGFRRFMMGIVPIKSVRRTQEIIDIMDKTSVEIYEHKMLALQQGDEAVLQQFGRGKDITSILRMCSLNTFLRFCSHLRVSESEHGSDR